MKKFTVEVWRNFGLVKGVVDTFTSEKDLESVAKDCLVYSRESNGSYIHVDKNVYFIIMDEDNILVYGSPNKNTIRWTEVSWF